MPWEIYDSVSRKAIKAFDSEETANAIVTSLDKVFRPILGQITAREMKTPHYGKVYTKDEAKAFFFKEFYM